MIRNRSFHLLTVVSLFLLLAACKNDEKYDGPSPKQVDGMYSNKLSAPNGGNLLLNYSGQPLIGKDIYFKMKDAGTAEITLFGVLPGEIETPIRDVALSAGTDSYTFTGKTNGTGGSTFRFEGSVAAGKMAINLTDIKISSSELSRNGTWYIIHSSKNSSTVYNGVGGNGTSSLIGTLYSFVGNKLVGNAISSVLDRLTFAADGNITAAYAPLPDSVKIGNLITGYGVTNRPAADWKQSPVNLTSYYVKDDADIYIVPNIDMIIRQVQLNQTKAGSNDITAGIKQLYKRLNIWSTTGIRLSIRPGSGTNLLLVLEKEEIEDLFLLIDIAKAILPAETLALPLTEALGGIIPPEYAPLIDLFLKGATLGSTLDLLRQELNTIPLEIGLYLSEKQTNN